MRDLRSSLRGWRTARKVIRYDGAVLPPRHIRYCGADFRDDATFLASGVAEAKRLVSEFGLNKATTILEIGCGPGRLPIGLIKEHSEIARYDGVDIDPVSVRWCQLNITRRYPSFRFHHVSARHRRYNPTGPAMDEGFVLPLEDSSYDLVYLHSVFANMEPDDVAVYTREFVRLLRPGGMVFLTAFIEENVPPITINPEDYIIKINGPLHVARYEKGYFLDLMTTSGLDLVHYGQGADLGGQTVVHLRRETHEATNLGASTNARLIGDNFVDRHFAQQGKNRVVATAEMSRGSDP